MERARADHAALRKIVMLELLPRADNEQLASLSTIYNITLRQLVAAAPLINGCELLMASHSSLLPATQDPAIRSAVFGAPSARGTDGIHFRGSEGRRRHTSSVITALKSALLGDRSSLGPQGATRQLDGRSYSQVVGNTIQSGGTYSQVAQRGRRAAPRQQDSPFILSISNQFEALGN